ncbi:MAG: bifunctional rhamnulose-1-phosphate aldolase/short-chain dehydrogenase [Armatimonadetes bacterium]|nr:bifunctional rhamnulose-1-phosphate aldolase/short-chain dehydrogenase [Armatimonadota bacterium]
MATTHHDSSTVPNLWDSKRAGGMDDVGQLVYASNLLGSDPRVTNFGGGNTSVKSSQADPLTGEEVEVMWVKGSGGDLGTAKRDGFASLYLDRVLALESKFQGERLREDEIVPLYNHCVFGLNPRACSIDTPLHAYVSFKAVSHMHADAVIAVAASSAAEALTQEIWSGEMGYLPWKRPGFELGLMLRDLLKSNPSIKGALMGSHGFINWADTWEECYADTIRMINQAQEFIDSRAGSHPFGDEVRPVRADDPRKILLEVLPVLRGKVSYEGKRLIANVDQSDEVLEYLSRAKMTDLAALGTSCPDHFLRTKICPMVLEIEGDMDNALAGFREGYAKYYERCKHDDSPAMRNPNPSVVLMPGVGMVSFGKNLVEARVTGEFYRNAIRVMRGAETISSYKSLAEQEAFNIEYWLLEEAKLKRQPPEKELSRQVALVTGAAQGIGLATAKKLASLGACVVLLDINEEKLEQARADVAAINNDECVLSALCDVTDGDALRNVFEETILKFGGLDIAVVNAGNARRGSVADTSCEDYEFLRSLLVDAYFDTMAHATRVMRDQGTGGSIIVIGSKNGTAAGSNAALYSAAKAFELHLMRCTAVDMAKHGIRANAVNPDAVVIGSGIWNDAWRAQTAQSLGIQPDEIEAHYRNRTMLQVDVTPDDIAEAVAWLASEARSSRTTGCTITVDGGNREGFVR